MPILDTFQIAETDYDINASELETSATIDGVAYEPTTGVSRYAVCATAAGTAAKVTTIANEIVISAGTMLRVKFSNGNTAENPTLTVNGGTAYPIMVSGANPAPAGAWLAGEVIDLCYDGANWQIVGGALATDTTAGRVMLDTTLSQAGKAADAKTAGDAIAAKQDTLTGTEEQYVRFDENGDPVATTPDSDPVDGSSNLVESGGVFDALVNLYPTDTISNVTVAAFPDGADGVPVKSLTVNITPVQTAGTPTPDAPLPISGWTGANVGVDGANDLDQTFELGTINSQGVPVASSGNMRSVYFSPVEPSTQYVILNRGRKNFRFFFYKADESFRYRSNSIQDPVVRFATGSDDRYIKIVFSGTEYDGNFVLCKADDIVDYPISFPAEAGTVYGGLLTDNGNGTWTMQPTFAIADLGTLTWTDNSTPLSATTGLQSVIEKPASTTDVAEAICSAYVVAARASIADAQISVATNGALVASDTRFVGKTAAQIQALLEGVQFVYRLATPAAPIPLTAETVKTLLGQNNIFADTGDVAELVYHADVSLYIAKKLSEV